MTQTTSSRSEQSSRSRQSLRNIFYWRLAVVAGICAGIAFLLVNIFFFTPGAHLGAWTIVRYLASIVLGERTLDPRAPVDAGTIVVGLVVTFALAILYAVILTFIIHRWGLLVGIIGGALFGAALYLINLYTFTLFFPWFFALNSAAFLVSFVVFGAVAGGVYELLDGPETPQVPPMVRGGNRP